MTVLCAGEALVSIRAQGPLRLGGTSTLSVAGSEANVAIGLSRLGVPSGWIGVLGEDELGALVRRTLQAEGVDCSAARTDPTHPTGLIVFEPRIGARTRALYYRQGAAGAQLGPQDVEAAFAIPRTAELSAVVTSGITPALAPNAADAARVLLDEGRRRGLLTCLSVNYRAALWSAREAARAIGELTELADVVVTSVAELPIAAGTPETGGASDVGALARELLACGPSEVVVTKGAAGACVYVERQRYDQPALEVTVRDTIGAGDAFTSGYLAGRLAHASIADSLRQGVASAAFCVSVEGDWEGLPTRRDLELLALERGDALR